MRLLLVGMMLSLCLVGNAYGASPQDAFPFERGDGSLCIFSYHLNEKIDISYRKGNVYQKDALSQIDNIFRSRSDNKVKKINLNLIELLDHLQDYFGADCLELISGYRSPNLQAELKKEGVNVSENSLHMKGQAADIHIDEITEEALALHARELAMGGAGFYPKWGFVHVDVGEIRNWELPDKPGSLLTAFKKDATWQLLTDKDLYLPHETIYISLMNITRTSKKVIIPIELQLFRRGEWKTIRIFSNLNGKILGAGKEQKIAWKPVKNEAYGKFRFVITGPKGFEYLPSLSNEFYRKSR